MRKPSRRWRIALLVAAALLLVAFAALGQHTGGSFGGSSWGSGASAPSSSGSSGSSSSGGGSSGGGDFVSELLFGLAQLLFQLALSAIWDAMPGWMKAAVLVTLGVLVIAGFVYDRIKKSKLP